MKITYLLLPALTMSLLACSSQQEEEYIETPEAEQISDLQDDDKAVPQTGARPFAWPCEADCHPLHLTRMTEGTPDGDGSP